MNSVVRHIAIDRQVPKASQGDFRGAMRQLTGGVSVITAGRGKDISGMTVTSVSSLSVDPPALIVSVNRGASCRPLLTRYGFFGVNILTSDQIDIADRFAGTHRCQKPDVAFRHGEVVSGGEAATARAGRRRGACARRGGRR